MTRAFAIVLLASLLATPLRPATDEASEIIRLAFEASERNDIAARNYTFHERIQQKFFGKKGRLKHSDSKTWDITLLDGSEYRRLIAKDGEPLGEKAAAKEERKLRKSIEKMRNETAREREKRRAKAIEEREERRKMVREITLAFNFKLCGEEVVDGIDTYVIDAEPLPGYKPAFRRADALKKVRGRLWISKADYGWVKADIETIDGLTWGLFLLRLHKGARIQFSQRQVNDEVWMMDNWRVRMSGRAGLIAGFNGEFDGAYTNFRRFSAETSITFGDSVQ